MWAHLCVWWWWWWYTQGQLKWSKMSFLALTNNDTGFVLRPSRPSANWTRSCCTRLSFESANDRRARSNSSGCFVMSCGFQYGQLPASIYDNVIPLGPLPIHSSLAIETERKREGEREQKEKKQWQIVNRIEYQNRINKHINNNIKYQNQTRDEQKKHSHSMWSNLINLKMV